MSKKETITVQGTEVTLYSQREDQYISLTDMAKFKNSEIPAVVISHWMSTIFSVNFMGIWEKMMMTETGFALSPKQWIEKTNAIGLISKSGRYGGGTFAHRNDENPDSKGNIRDYATLEQLVVLSNMESINALLIRQELPQGERLVQLNNVAITQMRSLVEHKNLKHLK
ncbi:MAG: hypothetical protein EZS26_002024 [Candidatus Ordinivivax streblomastigis]|uniref:KilA/APSES-type HTH DNA-binding domain-containing protein n=1 Tax=Candidatus Ordinivivax streblomastigis TaxID=2540710 RepID=A0A5M8P0C9_9BACT|nr:MAG: hypothetical protein EZS26_002024 [Candidatus Ordinivivax streblomastigis]